MISRLGVFCHWSKRSLSRFSNTSSKVITLFALAPILSNFVWSQVTEKVLYGFKSGSDGTIPYAGLIFDSRGDLYGTTSGGGSSGNGTVFKLTPSNGVWTETLLHTFTGSDGSFPSAGLIFDNAGNLYGTTQQGGSTLNTGTVFKLTPSNGVWTETVIYSFKGGSDGYLPFAGLIFDSVGNLYGTTIGGGANGCGTVFELTPSNGVWTETVIYNFKGGSDGTVPYAGLIFDSGGNLYGTTSGGGSSGNGTVFELRPSNKVWTEIVIYSFKGGSDGSLPFAGLIFDSEGNLYGATAYGGADGLGTVFELTPSNGGWMETVLHSFTGGDGQLPSSVLTFTAGNLFGTTQYGGAIGWGTVFKLDTSDNYTVLHSFAAGTDGMTPAYAGLAKDTAGNLYGTTSSGGSGGAGTVFEITGALPASPWQPLKNQPQFNASTALLLTDGTVMVQDVCASDWWQLISDNRGSYVNGAWKQLASSVFSPNTVYAPLYYASAVLPDGRVIVEGGEYNNTTGTICNLLPQSETTQGAIFDSTVGPVGTWTQVPPPTGWTQIGDAPSAVLSNETFMMGACCSTQQALLNAANLTWTTTGAGKTGNNSEEGWTLLPGFGSLLLTVDVSNTTPLMNSEQYLSRLGKWISAGSTTVELVDQTYHEVGPAVLRPDFGTGATVFATGATGYNAVYNTASATWSAAPAFPMNYANKQLAIPDGPAALLPDGNVLCDASPVIETVNGKTVYSAGSEFFEFNGTTLTAVVGPPNARNDPAYVGRMLLLPTGQVLFTDGTKDVEIYTPGGKYKSAWAPTIKSWPTSITHGQKNYAITGTQFNGLSQAVAYGDDAQAATNYPLIRISNNATKHVFYARTHGHSTMGVATGSTVVSTNFDTPSNLETGTSTLVVVANGIPSKSVAVTVQ
jgi:uncharacterized repeat protein (TIGR03803 family)